MRRVKRGLVSLALIREWSDVLGISASLLLRVVERQRTPHRLIAEFLAAKGISIEWHKEWGSGAEKKLAKLHRSERYDMNHPERRKARSAVARAIHRGILPSARIMHCVDCGAMAQEYDHHLGYDVAHRLMVFPRCHSCHAKRSKELIEQRHAKVLLGGG